MARLPDHTTPVIRAAITIAKMRAPAVADLLRAHGYAHEANAVLTLVKATAPWIKA
jgi:hypothetical protein